MYLYYVYFVLMLLLLNVYLIEKYNHDDNNADKNCYLDALLFIKIYNV